MRKEPACACYVKLGDFSFKKWYDRTHVTTVHIAYMRTSAAQTRLRIQAVSPKPSFFAYMWYMCSIELNMWYMCSIELRDFGKL